MTRRKIIAGFLVIIAFAAAARFYGLDKRGLFDADETRYYRDALHTREGIDSYVNTPGPKTWKGYMGSVTPLTQAFAGKPGHTILGLIGMYCFKDTQYAVLFVNALLGVLTILIVFRIGCVFFGAPAGLIGAAILSSCAASVLFSRGFLAHSDQAFFLVLGVYLYMKNRTLLSGLSFGYAFLIHPTGLIYFAPFLVIEGYRWIRRRRSLVGVLSFALFFLLPFAALETLSVMGRSEFGSLFTALDHSYISQIMFTNHEAAELGAMHNHNLGLFHLTIMSGLVNGVVNTVIFIISAVFCVIYAVKKRSREYFIVGIIPAALFVYWQFFSVHERLFREIAVLFPFFCLGAGIFISQLPRKVMRIILIVLVIEGAVYSSRAIIQIKTDYNKLGSYIAYHKIEGVITPSEYLATTADVLMPNITGTKWYLVSSMREAFDARQANHADYIAVPPSVRIRSAEFRLSGKPVIAVRDPHYMYFPLFYEAAKATGDTEYFKYRRAGGEGLTGLYSLKKEDV